MERAGPASSAAFRVVLLGISVAFESHEIQVQLPLVNCGGVHKKKVTIVVVSREQLWSYECRFLASVRSGVPGFPVDRVPWLLQSLVTLNPKKGAIAWSVEEGGVPTQRHCWERDIGGFDRIWIPIYGKSHT